jgi:hypothetical protein
MTTQIEPQPQHIESEYEIRSKIKQVILELLRDYGPLTKTMLSSHASSYAIQYGLGWQTIYDELLEDGAIERFQRVRGDGRKVWNIRLPSTTPPTPTDPS